MLLWLYVDECDDYIGCLSFLHIYYIIQRFISFATIHLKTKLKWNVANKVKKLWEKARIVLPLQNKYLLNTYILWKNIA